MNNDYFLPDIESEDQRRLKDWISRLNHYVRWLNLMGLLWFYPEIEAYIEYLVELETLQPATIRARISAVRTRYLMLSADQQVSTYLAQELKGDMDQVNKCLKAIRLAADVHRMRFPSIPYKKPDKRSYIKLTTDQASQFLNRPDPHTLRGLRDRAIIALIMATGLRESEVILLTVDDLNFTNEETQAGVHVPEGPASTERFVPFYTGFPVQRILKTWLSQTNIQEGPVFRGFYRNGQSMRDTGITVQAIEDIFAFYPLTDGEIYIYLKPIDLRVFYAQLLYKLDFSLDVISQNLGVQTQTAMNYIGTPSKRLDKIPVFLPAEGGNYN